MQRWIAAGVVALVLVMGGAWFGYRSYLMNRPHPIWVPLPVRADLKVEERDRVIRELKSKLSEMSVLVKVSRDLGLAKRWGLASDELCARELGARLFVRAGDADTPMGKVPAIHIGVNGKEREVAESGEIALRLMEDVGRILGIKIPTKRSRSDVPDHF